MEKKLITNVKFEGIDHKDYPDYCDAYVVSADYNGEPMTDEQIEDLAQDTGLVYDLLIEHLY